MKWNCTPSVPPPEALYDCFFGDHYRDRNFDLAIHAPEHLDKKIVNSAELSLDGPNRQSLVFSERGQLSQAIPQVHVERLLH